MISDIFSKRCFENLMRVFSLNKDREKVRERKDFRNEHFKLSEPFTFDSDVFIHFYGWTVLTIEVAAVY